MIMVIKLEHCWRGILKLLYSYYKNNFWLYQEQQNKKVNHKAYIILLLYIKTNTTVLQELIEIKSET